MTCDTKYNSISYLKEEKAVDDTRIILDETIFDKSNEFITNVAIEKYGLDTGGKMLFVPETTTHRAMEKDFATSGVNKVTRAVPVEEFFEKLDVLVERHNIVEKDAVAIIQDRISEPIVVNVGNKYTSSPIKHFTTSKPYSSKKDTQVRIRTKGFLNQTTDRVFYNRLVSEYEAVSGIVFNINNNTKSGNDQQLGFYKFLTNKGLLGLEVLDSRGDSHMIKFDSQIELKFSDTEVDTEVVSESLTDELVPVDKPVGRSVLESMNWFEQSELDALYRTYSPAEINQFVKEDIINAEKVFTDLLYPNEFKNDIFVSDEDVNYQIKKCK
jgi:hypothetical protein